jgi:hypothetical protein
MAQARQVSNGRKSSMPNDPIYILRRHNNGDGAPASSDESKFCFLDVIPQGRFIAAAFRSMSPASFIAFW